MAHLEYLSNEGKGQIISLTEDEFLIGRSKDCDLFVDDSRVSRKHAVITVKDHQWFIRDLDSKNGTVVNGEKVQSIHLSDYDVIGVGPALLRFVSGDFSVHAYRVRNREDVTQIASGVAVGSESQRRLNLLLEVANAIDTIDSTRELLSSFNELVFRLFNPSYCSLQFKEAQIDKWQLGITSTPSGQKEVDDFIYQVKVSANAMLIKDKSSATVSESFSVISVMGVPILLNDQAVGCLYVDKREQGGTLFTDDDLMLLVGVGRLISAAVAGATRFAKIDAQNRMLSAGGGRAGQLVGSSSATVNLKELIEQRIGPVKSTVLLTGETGTGKSMVAQSIHLASERAKGPYVSINCAAIPRELIESELFGHEKGAFSGANDRKLGLFETASEGTIFLDEISELDFGAQAKLLTVLQERKLKRVGGTATIDVDIRILAATNHDLKKEVDERRFREDLYYRLNVVNLEIPPLRERPQDIPELAGFFLEKACHDMGRRIPGISDDAMSVLLKYRWPGNVRELSNCMERAAIFGLDDFPIGPGELPTEITDYVDEPERFAAKGEKEMIEEALTASGGNKRKAARLLGWYPQKFYSRLKKYNIQPD